LKIFSERTLKRGRILSGRALKKLKNAAFVSISTILFFVVWEIAVKTGMLKSGVVPDALATIERLFKNLSEGVLWQNTLISFKRAFYGFLAAAGGGVTAGFLLGTVFKKVTPVIMPLLRFLEKLHPLAIFPVVMLFFGIGDKSKIFTLFWAAVWPVLAYTLIGIENADPLLIRYAKSTGAKLPEIYGKVLIPAAFPDIFTGVVSGAQIALIFVVSTEMQSSSTGLGYLIQTANIRYNLLDLYSSIIFVAILGILLTKGLKILENHIFVWKEKLNMP